MQTVMAASDSETDEIDENAIHDVEAGADLLESVYFFFFFNHHNNLMKEGTYNYKHVVKPRATCEHRM